MTKDKFFFLSLLFASCAMAKKVKITNVAERYTSYDEIRFTDETRQKINIGFSSTSGNSETLNLNGKYLLSSQMKGYKEEPLKVAFKLSAFFTKNNGVKSNEEYIAIFGFEQVTSKDWLFYSGMNWLRNPTFRNYDNKLALNIGVGREIYNRGRHLLVAKIGTAYNLEDYANEQESEHFGSLNEYLEYNNKLNALSNLYYKLGSMQNFNDFNSDYEVVNVLGITFEITQKLSLTIEEEIAYDNLPAVGFKKSDTKSIIQLGYTF